METIKLRDAIAGIDKTIAGVPKGWEYLNGWGKDKLVWLPTKHVVNKFVDTIGDKWNLTGKKHDRITYDLLDTNIVISGHYIMARGGLCPSGVRLFEIEDHDKLDALISRMTA
jgi:hypothetical protein